MTTVDTAAAWHTNKPVALAVIVSLAAFGLAGCETGSNLLGQSGPSTTLADQAAPPAAAPTPAAKRLATIAIAPVIGAPDAVARQLQTQLTAATEKRGFGFVKSPLDKLDYTLRGYVVSAREAGGTKVSYIWDVTDPTGRRVNRITGEEKIPGAENKDPWVQVSTQVTQSIADKTAQTLESWAAGAGAQAGVPVASNATSLGGPAVAATQPVAAPAAPVAVSDAALRQGQPTGPTTGSIAGSVTASVPSVVGAPGDGSTALTGALQRELTRGGIALSDPSAPTAYRVEGRVKLGEGREGKQPITIDWDVKDPKGKKLGTVSQKNEIPQGSLDGAWGKTADAAAAAAAQGILKLIPNARSTN